MAQRIEMKAHILMVPEGEGGWLLRLRDVKSRAKPPTQINESDEKLPGLLLYRRRRRRREKRKGKKGEELGKRHKITKRVQIGGCPSRLWK